jgi:replicative DNA helicase
MDDSGINLYSPETELAALGHLLNAPNKLADCDLSGQHFYLARNRIIFEAMQVIRQRGDAPDYVTLGTELSNRGKLAEIGGPARLMDILNHSGLFLESYVGILKDLERRRRLVELAGRVATLAVDRDSDLEAAMPGFIRDMVSTAEIKGAAEPFSEVISRFYDEVSERADNPTDTWGITTGYKRFDKLTGGLQQSELFILSGEPGIGKSMWAMQAGMQMAGSEAGAIYSMEMKSLAVARRLVSGWSKINTRKLKTGRLEEQDWPMFTHAIETLGGLNFFISEHPRQTIASLRKDISRLVATENIKWFIVDYLYLIQEGANEIERTQLASSGLKQICMEFNLAGLAIHSMNKAGIASVGAGTEEAPTQDKLRGSGQSIYDADLIAFLTKYNFKLDPAKDKIAPAERDNVRTLWFGKGRELESSDKFIQYERECDEQGNGLPYFKEYERKARLP